jgi:hypothetical protein
MNEEAVAHWGLSRQMQINTHLSCLFRMCFNIIFLPTPNPPSTWFFSFRCFAKNIVWISVPFLAFYMRYPHISLLTSNLLTNGRVLSLKKRDRSGKLTNCLQYIPALRICGFMPPLLRMAYGVAYSCTSLFKSRVN